MILSAVYQLVLYDSGGARLAIIDDYRSLQYQNVVNGGEFFTLIINATDSKVPLFENNGILEVRRRIPGTLPWYTDFVGHIENQDDTLFENGNQQLIFVGSGLNGLLDRRIVAYRDGTSQSAKGIASETAMKEYVNENCGPVATVANGRLANGVITNFTVDLPGGGAGAVWDGERSGKKLLETIQDIANFSGLDFAVETNTVVGTYIFNTYENQLGTDRTTAGLDSTTGLNAAGNAPHIFSPERGNIKTARRVLKRRRERNRVYAFGKGQGPTRAIEYQEAAAEIDVDNLNLKEAMRGAISQDSVAELLALSAEWLEKLAFEEKFEFSPLDVQSSLYGVHYNLGDKVTVKLGDAERDKKIVSVSITVSRNGENKRIDFQDIPR